MTPTVIALISTIAASPVIGIIATHLLGRRPRHASLEERIERLEIENSEAKAEGRRLADYVEQLRRHISEGNPPPPPPWPEAVLIRTPQS